MDENLWERYRRAHREEEAREPGEEEPLEYLLACPACGALHDIRYLHETCRRDDQQQYRCVACNAPLP